MNRVTDLQRRLSSPEPEDVGRERMPSWKKFLLAGATALVLTGVVLKARAWMSGSDDAAPSTSTAPEGGTSFVPGGTPGSPGDGPAPEEEKDDWSPFFFKGGLSFFLGFCVGHALRAFYKVSAVAIGVVVLCILGLKYFGVVDVDWTMAEDYYTRAVATIKDESSDFYTFLTGSVPSAATLGLGLFAGFKRK